MAKGLVAGLPVGSCFSDCLLLGAKEQGRSQDPEGKCCFLCVPEGRLGPPQWAGLSTDQGQSHSEDLWFSDISLRVLTLAPD